MIVMHRFPHVPIICLLCAFGFVKASGSETIWETLSPARQAELTQGKTVETEQDVTEGVWPRFTVYKLVKASPRSVAAVFWDCERAPEYVPNCTSVKLLSHPEPALTEAEYTLSMPFFLPDEVYVSRNRLERPAPGVYEISWSLLKSRYSRSSVGSLRVEEHEGRTLIRYRNLVVPASRFAGMLRASAGKEVVESVRSLGDRVEKEMESAPSILKAQEEKLDRDLTGIR
jgi:Polyketide cyclase / dehydrase and lipid transport